MLNCKESWTLEINSHVHLVDVYANQVPQLILSHTTNPYNLLLNPCPYGNMYECVYIYKVQNSLVLIAQDSYPTPTHFLCITWHQMQFQAQVYVATCFFLTKNLGFNILCKPMFQCTKLFPKPQMISICKFLTSHTCSPPFL